MTVTTESYSQGILAVDFIRRRHMRLGYKGIEDARIGIYRIKAMDLDVDEDNGNRDIFGVATTDDVDESEEVILPSGIDTSYIDKAKQLYADHQYGSEYNIGHIRTFRLMSNGRGMKFRARIYSGLKHPLADDTLEKIKQCGTYGVSIGFDALEYGSPTPDEQKRYPGVKSVVRKSRIIELSTTPMPCNQAAYCSHVGVLSDQKRHELIEDLVTKSLLPKERLEEEALAIVKKAGILPVVDNVSTTTRRSMRLPEINRLRLV